MEKDFGPEKPSLKDIIEEEPTKIEEKEATMIHPSTLPNTQSARADRSSRNASPSASPASTPSKSVDPNHFPTHLYKMLEEIDNGEGAAAQTVEGRTFVSIVSWQPHGKCFLIHDEDLFSKYVLPKYFCRLKFTSFQRQLHFHGFKRLCKQGPDKGAYYHDLFARGMPEVATYIQRIKSSKGFRGRKRKSQDPEPDFYKQSSPPIPAAIVAKAKTSSDPTESPPEPPKLSLPTNEAPQPCQLDDSADMVRLEPTPIGQIRPVQGGQIPPYDQYQEERPTAPSPKRQRREVPHCNVSSEESKFNNRVDMAAMQQILHQGGDVGLRDARSELQDLSDRPGPLASSLMGVSQMNTSSARNDDDWWHLGMFHGSSMERGEISAALGQQQQMSFQHPLDLELEPAPIRFPQGQHQRMHAPGHQQLQQSSYEAEDQLHQQILRQIDEQQRQLRQQRQNILQRQQLQLQQRQMNSLFQERLDPYALQHQQQPQPLQQQQGMSEQPFPLQQLQQDERVARLGGERQRQSQPDPSGASPQNQMSMFPKRS